MIEVDETLVYTPCPSEPNKSVNYLCEMIGNK